MIKQQTKQQMHMDAIGKLRNHIHSLLYHQKMAVTSMEEQEAIQFIYQNLMVQILIGQKKAVQTFLPWYLARNSIEKRQSAQSDLIQWICLKDITRQIYQIIVLEYKILLKAQIIEEDQSNRQIQVKEAIISQVVEGQSNNSIKIQAMISDSPNGSMNMNESNSPDIFEVINFCESNKEQVINQYSLSQQEVLFYTHEQMINQLKIELQGTPQKTTVSKNNQSEQEQSLKIQNYLQEYSQQSPQCLFSIPQVKENELYNDNEKAIQKSEQYGHFLNGDKVEEFLQIFYYRNQSYITVKWKNRLNGIQPKDSALLSEIVKYHCPQLLISFYQRKFPILIR